MKQIETAAKRGPLKLLAPLVKARKGFHTDVARWAERQGFDTLYVDGKLIPIAQFRRLERFKEHTIDVVVGVIGGESLVLARLPDARLRLAEAQHVCSIQRIALRW
jgi:excinuclease ABC subunit A